MLRTPRIACLLVGIAFAASGPQMASATEDFLYHHENVLGTSLELQIRADSEPIARAAEAHVLREIDRLAAIFSTYDRTSEFSRWQQTLDVPTAVSPELFAVLQASDLWRERSGGAFDPRVQTLIRLWSDAAKSDRLPSAETLETARAALSRPAWRLDPATGTATHLTRDPLTLDAIAKGFIVERACASGIGDGRAVRGLLLNIGGDLRVCGDMPRPIGIASPHRDSETTESIAHIKVANRSVATSGNYQRGLRIGGKWYSHIFDPRTGQPVAQTVSATVVSESGAEADALATIFNVLPVEESLRLAAATPGVECMLVSRDGKISRSAGWNPLEVAAPGLLAFQEAKAKGPAPAAKDDKPSTPAAPWKEGMELLVKFEIKPAEGDARRYRRPYVAIWVEDKDGLPVRTLTLWVQSKNPGPRWIPDLKRWYRDDQVRKLVDDTNLVETVSRATRPPGKYEVIWDGKDDAGQPLPGGEYTVTIEAAREHGTYQIIRNPVKLADKPFVEELKGNAEIKSAALLYRRKDSPK